MSSPILSPSAQLATTTSSALARRTPASRPRRSELPPSPADVADLAEYETTQIYAGLNDLYTLSGIPEGIEYTRELCSSVTGIQTAFTLLETLAMGREVLPWNYLCELSGVRGLGWPTVAIYYPDLFALLSSNFWLPTLLWLSTSIALPALFGYFFNLTIRSVRRHGAVVSVARYTVDPLTFNIVKALATWIVYGKGVGTGFLPVWVPLTVNHALLGGYNGVLVGCYVGVIASLYEAAQRK